MPQLTLTRSIVLPRPVIDDKTKKPLVSEVKFRGRTQEVPAYENELLPAGTVVEIKDAVLLKELLDNGYAREFDAVLDDADGV